jgi:chitodextrinase
MNLRNGGFIGALALSIFLCASTRAAAQTACATAWSSTSIYTAGMTASLNGVNYVANFWTQNQSPATNSGGAGSGLPWTSTGACGGSGSGSGSTSGCDTPWSSTAVYTSGNTASENGVNYVANFWTQNQNPTTNNGGAGSGAPWTITGNCAVCSTIASAPTGLHASGTTACGTSLTWTAVGAPSNCSVSGYTVFKNGTSIGTTTGTTFSVGGLSPSTVYTFAVAATDGAGASAESGTISVTTAAGACAVASGVFSPYIDMGLTADWQIVSIQSASAIKTFTMGFIISNGSCAPEWGGVGATVANDTLPNGNTIVSLVGDLRAAGADVIISFGGAAGTELATDTSCTTASQLQAAYQAVINKYSASSSSPVRLDFDVEGSAVNSPVRSDGVNSVDLRNQALTALAAANPGLQIHYTLPVLPTGLIASGVAVLTSAKSHSTPVSVVNVMCFDYGSAVDNGGQMALDAMDAAQAVHGQIQTAGLTATVGITPDLGVDDSGVGETFTLANATTLLQFAQQNSYITRLSYCEVSRDNGSCAGASSAEVSCSGLSQATWAFAQIFEPFQ